MDRPVPLWVTAWSTAEHSSTLTPQRWAAAPLSISRAWAEAFRMGSQPRRIVVLPPVEMVLTQDEGSVGAGSHTILSQAAFISSQTILRKPVELP